MSPDDGGGAADPESDHRSDADPEPFALPAEAVRPSQLYLDGRKLASVTDWFDFADPNYDPLPVRKVAPAQGDEAWTLTDGHTRAFVAHLAGIDELRVVRDTDDLPMETYRQCVAWCEEEGITEIADLAGRVLDAEAFEEQWVERCRSVADTNE